jgi:hypothetical protein
MVSSAMISAPGFSANTRLPKRYVDFYEATGTPERGRGYSLVTLRCGMPKKAAFLASPKGKATFREQKQQKNFFKLGPCRFRCHRPKVEKVFAPLFSKSGHFPGV